MQRYTSTVDHKDGWLCVKDHDTDSMEPIRYFTWYPVRQVPRADTEAFIGREAHRVGSSGGRYVTRTANYPNGYQVELPLLNGGQTTPIAFEKEPIPCPKVRKGIETRYRNGAWEKYLKTQGWVQL